MPLYEYQCTACGKRIEKIQKFADEPLTECPECGGKLERLLSSSAIQFKGSGWYVTDYAKKSSGGSKSDSDGKGDSAKDSGSKDKDSGTKKDSKPKAEPASKNLDRK